EAQPPVGAALEFTGQGAEYFRIWVVNTALTVLTLGIYSAWAKVRKTSYFARNTLLLGDCFEFTADPVSILRGRIVALLLLGFYTFAFDFSRTLGLVATFVLLVLAPLLLASATRFRLQNTRWRAIRFEFTATWAEAYRAALVVIGLWISATVIGSLFGVTSAAIVTGLVALMLPWMHHRLKAFQHRHVRFAGNASSFRSAVGAFYGIYVLALLILVAVGIVASMVTGIVVVSSGGRLGNPKTIGIIIAVLVVLLAYLACWPYFASRIQRTVWERTALGPFSFETTIAFRTLFPIALRNFVLLLVSAGLYWPFASIAWARYRIGCMSVISEVSSDASLAAIDPGSARSAVGEGAADFFGLDIGW
ncbi:MAG: YjgN family protein, partial [Caldimonas sp.]